MRVPAAEVSQARHQPFLCQFSGHRHPQHRLGARVTQFVAGLADQFEGLLQVMQQAPGFGTGAYLAADTPEQDNTELLLELANLVTDSAVGDTQFGGGAAEVAVAGSTLEGAQGSQ